MGSVHPSPQLCGPRSFCLVFGTGIVFSLYLWAFIPLKHSYFSLAFPLVLASCCPMDGTVMSSQGSSVPAPVSLSFLGRSHQLSFLFSHWKRSFAHLFQGGCGWICLRFLSSPPSVETKGHFVVDGYNPFLLLFHASTHTFKSKQYCREFVFQENPLFFPVVKAAF